MKTELKSRVLWFDGTNEVDAELVPQLIALGVPISKIVVPQQNEDVALFNSLSDEVIALEKKKNDVLDLTWNVPSKFIELNLNEYVEEQLIEFLYVCEISQEKREEYRKRTSAELQEIQVRGLENLFKTLVYVIARFNETGTIWGVGRGSSCASLVLYLIGLHKVDPIKFGIPMSEFFHD